jgi:hypothetical protein
VRIGVENIRYISHLMGTKVAYVGSEVSNPLLNRIISAHLLPELCVTVLSPHIRHCGSDDGTAGRTCIWTTVEGRLLDGVPMSLATMSSVSACEDCIALRQVSVLCAVWLYTVCEFVSNGTKFMHPTAIVIK